jgi:hypothetical protein
MLRKDLGEFARGRFASQTHLIALEHDLLEFDSRVFTCGDLSQESLEVHGHVRRQPA